MKILHLSDLHIGKTLGNFSLLEDQRYVLRQILDIIISKDVEAVIIAGDIFDTSLASSDAWALYNEFIEKIVFEYKIPVLAIAGNHDSSKRLDVNKRFYSTNNYYLYGEYSKEPITLYDEYGPINFYLLPFIPINKARTIFSDDINDFTDLYRYALKDIKYDDRNVLITHCYAANGITTLETEYHENQKPLVIGGTDAMDANLFKKFDYVALGHLHRPHYVLEEKIRYSGTFMPYSFDKNDTNKSITIIDLKKDCLDIEKVKVKLLRDFELRQGYFEDLIKEEPSDSYIKFILKDDSAVENAMAKLKVKFPKAVLINYSSKAVFTSDEDGLDIDIENKDSLELFADFIKFKQKRDISTEEYELMKEIIGDLNEG